MAIKSGGKERTGGKGSVFLFSGRYVFGAEKRMSEAAFMAIKSGGKERTGGKGSVFLFSGRYVFGAEKRMSEAAFMAIKSGGKERTGGKGSVFLFSGRYAFGVEKGMSEASKKRPVFRALSGCFCFLKRRTICSAEQQLQRQSLLLFSGCLRPV